MIEKYEKPIGAALLIIICFVFVFSLVGFADNRSDETKNDKFLKDLEGLMDKGIITDEELVKIKDYFKIEREEKRKIFEQMKNMDEAQRKEFIRDYKRNKTNVVDKMVQDKVITTEQAESIRKIMPRHKHKKRIN